MADRTHKFGDAIMLYAVAAVYGVCALVMLFICWQAAIPLGLCSIGMALFAYFRCPTMIWDAEGITFSNPRRKLHQAFPWPQFTCLYQLAGTTREMLVFTPRPLSKTELRALAARAKKLRGPVPAVDDCLAISGKRIDPRWLALIPDSIRRMPFADCISL